MELEIETRLDGQENKYCTLHTHCNHEQPQCAINRMVNYRGGGGGGWMEQPTVEEAVDKGLQHSK